MTATLLVFYIASPVIGIVSLAMIYPQCVETSDRYAMHVAIAVIIYQLIGLFVTVINGIRGNSTSENEGIKKTEHSYGSV